MNWREEEGGATERPAHVTLSALAAFTPLRESLRRWWGAKRRPLSLGPAQLSACWALQWRGRRPPMRRDIVEGARVQQNAIRQECAPPARPHTPTLLFQWSHSRAHRFHSCPEAAPFPINTPTSRPIMTSVSPPLVVLLLRLNSSADFGASFQGPFDLSVDPLRMFIHQVPGEIPGNLSFQRAEVRV